MWHSVVFACCGLASVAHMVVSVSGTSMATAWWPPCQVKLPHDAALGCKEMSHAAQQLHIKQPASTVQAPEECDAPARCTGHASIRACCTPQDWAAAHLQPKVLRNARAGRSSQGHFQLGPLRHNAVSIAQRAASVRQHSEALPRRGPAACSAWRQHSCAEARRRARRGRGRGAR